MTTTTTATCATCDAPLPAVKRRGRPSRYCSPACRKAADATRKRRDRQRAADVEEAKQAAKVAAVKADLLALLDEVNPLPDEPALTPGSYEWHVYALDCLTYKQARLYRRLWTTAATASERRQADNGRNVPIDPARLREAAQEVAEAIADPAPFTMSTPPALRIDPGLVRPDDPEARAPFAFVTQAEADGFPTADGPLDAPIGYGYGGGYVLDDYYTYEADPARRRPPFVRLVTPDDPWWTSEAARGHR